MPPAPLQTSATAEEASPSVEAVVEEETVMDAFERRAKSLMSSLGTNLCASSLFTINQAIIKHYWPLSSENCECKCPCQVLVRQLSGRTPQRRDTATDYDKSCFVFGFVNR